MNNNGLKCLTQRNTTQHNNQINNNGLKCSTGPRPPSPLLLEPEPKQRVEIHNNTQTLLLLSTLSWKTTIGGIIFKIMAQTSFWYSIFEPLGEKVQSGEPPKSCQSFSNPSEERLKVSFVPIDFWVSGTKALKVVCYRQFSKICWYYLLYSFICWYYQLNDLTILWQHNPNMI